ncbi:MAG TPA: hopanoid biosynthesis-associated protein HpnK [Thermoanaerobaculia bacterium]|nr:hopanoid biosynthesis-associated protein HpnK [Thermoanaerobaculia bacterium]
MKRLVVTGDDFGLFPRVNRAICEAHDRGILTAASLMVGAPAAAEAVALARARPGLAVGLHLAVVDAVASLPPVQIPELADRVGRLRASPLSAGLLYQFSSAARGELKREIRCQLETFQKTGLTLSHVDGHHHMHLHPFVLGVLLELAREFQIRWIRIPAGELSVALGANVGGAVSKIFWSAVFGALRLTAKKRVAAAGVSCADRVYGLLQTGRIDEDYVLRLTPRMGDGLSELYCHPGASAGGPAKDPELAALVSGRVRKALEQNAIATGTFSGRNPTTTPRASSKAAR